MKGSATPADTTAPAVPAGLTATAGIHAVTLTWTANTDADLRGYRIYRDTSAAVAINDDTLIAIVLKNGGRTFLDSDLDAGTKYYYALVSYDTTGNRSAATPSPSSTPKPAFR